MDLRKSILNQTDVSLSLAKHVISAQEKNGNLIFSPLSFHVVLGLITAGSNGPTRDQLLGFLKIKSAEDLNSLSSQLVRLIFGDGTPLGGPHLSFANSVWIDQTLNFKSGFKEIVDNDYKAASRHVDFQTKAVEVTNEVNAWASKETNGLIEKILPPGSVDASTRLIIANAVYFKGVWNQKFNASSTKDDEFFLLNGSSVQVPFMTSRKNQRVREFDGFKVLGLSYKQGEDNRKFSMYIFLPDAKDGLLTLVEKLGSTSGFLKHHLPYDRPVEVGDFLIPKFKIEFFFEASEILKGQGLLLPFSVGGLTEMVASTDTSQEICISRIFHKSFIEVNEEGTEAAAVTVCVLSPGCSRFRSEVDFVADHPFLFVIREDVTGVVMFIGQVLNPLADDEQV